MYIKHELQNIISRNGFVRNGKNIQTITNYLRRKKETISNFKEGEFTKDEETKILIDFINESDLWFTKIDISKYIGAGAEQ